MPRSSMPPDTLGRLLPDALVGSAQIPGTSGDDLARMLRKANPHLPVVFTTGRVEEATSLGGRTKVLIKPFGAEELIEAISQLAD